MLFEKIQLEPDEIVLKVVRRHWFVIMSEFVGVFIVGLFPIIVSLLYPKIEEFIPALVSTQVQNFNYLFGFGAVSWILICVLNAFVIWTHYYLDLWIVTDRRIIAIDQIRFFNRKVSSFRLERLQDMKALVNGIIPTFLNYGTLHAHTAGTDEDNFTTTGLPDPRGLQSIIQGAVDTRLARLNQNVSE